MATDGKMRQKKLYSACLNLDLKGARLSDSYYYNSLPLCLIDAIYSIGVHYTSVENAVKNFCKNVDTPRISYMRDPNTEKVKYDCYKMEDLLKVLEKYSSSQYGAKDIFKNEQKTSTRNGIPKAEAIFRAATILVDHNINTFSDLRNISEVKLTSIEKEYCKIPGQGTADHISWNYFLMLSGDDNHIKVDRWIERFYEESTGETVSRAEIESDLKTICNQLNSTFPEITPRLLDHTIWNTLRKKE